MLWLDPCYWWLVGVQACLVGALDFIVFAVRGTGVCAVVVIRWGVYGSRALGARHCVRWQVFFGGWCLFTVGTILFGAVAISWALPCMVGVVVSW